MSAFDLQSLEPRTLLAFHPTSGLLTDPTIVADRAAVQAAFTELSKDARAGRTTIHTDQQAIRDELKKLADDKGQDAINDALQPLKDKLRADEKSKHKELRAAAEELRTAKRAWNKTIHADLAAWRDARVSGDQDAIDAARKKLEDDRKAAQDDLKPIRDKITAIANKWRPIITADHDAITAKLEELDPALKPLFDKFASDTDKLTTELKSDQEALADATEKLNADIKAWRDAHKPTDVA